MTDDAPGNPPPAPDDPWLEELTFEQMAQLVNEISPEVLYQRASAFDQAGSRLQDVLDRIRHEMNLLRDAWTGKGAEEFDGLVRGVTTRSTEVLQYLQSPGYGEVMRTAGDRLADHQQRFRDLQGQKTQQDSMPAAPGAPPPEETAKVTNDSAKQILLDLRTAYWDVGNALTPLPFKAPTVITGVTVMEANSLTTPGSIRLGGGTENGAENTDNLGGPNTVTGNSFVAPPPVRTAPGSGPVMFGGPDGHVIGRTAPGGRDGHQDVVFASEQHPDNDHVLGQTYVVSRAPFAGDTDGMAPPITSVPQSVLGRTPAGAPSDSWFVVGRTSGDTGRYGKRSADPGQKPGGEYGYRSADPDQQPGEPLFAPLETRPETVSADRPLIGVRGQVPEPNVIVTTVDSPTDAAEQERTGEVVAELAATTQPEQHLVVTPEVPAETPAPPPEAPAKPDGTPTLDSGGTDTFATTVPAEGGENASNVTFNPESRGMFAPGATQDALPDLPAEQGTGPAASGRGGAVDAPSGPMGGGMPMAPMMGGGMGMGMGGMGQQQGGRMAAMPNEARPEIWDPATTSPNVVGRRDQEPERGNSESPLSKEDIKARLGEKFADLDRLMERRK